MSSGVLERRPKIATVTGPKYRSHTATPSGSSRSAVKMTPLKKRIARCRPYVFLISLRLIVARRLRFPHDDGLRVENVGRGFVPQRFFHRSSAIVKPTDVCPAALRANTPPPCISAIALTIDR